MAPRYRDRAGGNKNGMIWTKATCMHKTILWITSTSKRDHMSSVMTLFDLEVTYWKSRANGQTSRKKKKKKVWTLLHYIRTSTQAMTAEALSFIHYIILTFMRAKLVCYFVTIHKKCQKSHKKPNSAVWRVQRQVLGHSLTFQHHLKSVFRTVQWQTDPIVLCKSICMAYLPDFMGIFFTIRWLGSKKNIILHKDNLQ